MPERLWLGATIDVILDGSKILSTSGKFKFQGDCVEQFVHSGTHHQVKLEWGKFLIRSVPCSLYVDDQLVAQETVEIENWQMNLVGLTLFSALLFVLCYSLFFIGQVVSALLALLGG
jgi:hypothetical protein